MLRIRAGRRPSGVRDEERSEIEWTALAGRYRATTWRRLEVTRPDVTLFGMTALRASVTRLRNGCGSLASPSIPKGNDWLTAGEVAPSIEAASVALAAGAIRIDSTVVNREDLVRQLQILDNLWEGLQSKSRHDDFSDLPQESLQYVMRARTLVDRVAAGTTYAAEIDRVREQKPHMRIPVLRAVLESMCAEAEG
jgi:hypothetical protein